MREFLSEHNGAERYGKEGSRFLQCFRSSDVEGLTGCRYPLLKCDKKRFQVGALSRGELSCSTHSAGLTLEQEKGRSKQNQRRKIPRSEVQDRQRQRATQRPNGRTFLPTIGYRSDRGTQRRSRCDQNPGVEIFQARERCRRNACCRSCRMLVEKARIRRGESAELYRTVLEIQAQQTLRRLKHVLPLKDRFFQLVGEQRSSPARDPRDVQSELTELRTKLLSSSAGLMFLTKILSSILEEAEKKGELSDSSLKLLVACAGEEERVRLCITFNSKIREAEKANKPSVATQGTNQQGTSETSKGTGTREPELSRQLLQLSLLDMLNDRSLQLDLLVKQEQVLEKLQAPAAALPSADTINRISRAEAAVDLRFHRALVLLLALKNPELNPRFLLN